MDISNEQSRIGHEQNNQYSFNNNKTNKSVSTPLSMGKVFGYLFLGLGVTFLVCIIISIIFTKWITTDPDNAVMTLFYMMIGSIIFQLVLTVIMNIGINKAKFNLMIPYLLYGLTMGVMLSTFTIFLPWEVISITIGITTLIFGVLSLIGILTKSNLNSLIYVASALVIGSLLLVGFNFLMVLFFPEMWDIICWIVSIGLFAAIMFVTIYDVWQIKKISQNGYNSKNISLWCAYRLYLDYISILIRVLYFVIIAYSKDKN